MARWGDLFNASFGKSISQPVCVRRFIINQLRRSRAEDLLISKRLDCIHFGHLSARGKQRDRNPLRFGHHHDFGAFPFLGLANLKAPFFSGENVPSPNASDQFSFFCPFIRRSNRAHAVVIAPVADHIAWRRQHVVKGGMPLW